MSMSQNNGNGMRPVWSCKAGGVSAAVFVNDRVSGGKRFVTRNVVVERAYKDKDGRWQRTSAFNEQDLVKLRLVVDKAISYLFSSDTAGENDGDMGEPERAPPAPSLPPDICQRLAECGVVLGERTGQCGQVYRDCLAL